MRKILFRGKAVCDGSWVEGDLIGVSSDFGGAFIRRKYNASDRVDPDTVGQFIGFTDCEGREIFEGDIIRWARNEDYKDYLNSLKHPEAFDDWDFSDMWMYSEVLYGADSGDPSFCLLGAESLCGGLANLINSGEWHFEVCGNIYDDPDMRPFAPISGE